MLRRWILSTFAILLSIILTACNTTNTRQPQAQATQSITTTNTPSQELAKLSAKRVVTLSSLTTDIIFQLDKTKLVGIAGSSLFKNDPRFQDIPRISEGQSPPNLEKIVALKPDLVIGAEGFSNQPIQRLQQLGIPTLLTQVNTWKSLEEITAKLAQLIDVNPQPLLERYQSFLADRPGTNTPILVLVSSQPILAPNKNSWAGDLLEKFQVKNLAAELQGKSPIAGYVTLSAEKVLEANPEAVVLITPPQGGSKTEVLASFKKESFWQKLPATKNNRVYVFDYYGLVNPGSIDAIKQACEQIKKDLLG
ncbi:Periplasmic binding protein [Trichormus variabilis ATCC 29413]|uniref:Periplasmic binding protein n=2 Tax=Anabaena variabilis TaxID=264691 RepID=Q3MCA0_TRIV2|nr:MULTISPECIES: ABC transporter substrate-binding protein [Nostocaceae]ABA21386.1 Periplasmic binding protein [Trichormus variabilis ATCC 29413]MBC1213614.1 ABC transporter substrate-binding protein [Trichormus variabilis ARAD]MBC1258103.1 ABC transporter substrate-binding protein [Trichormus variabilis V5]MBC1268239.1 ABC transporter substrate-binding protein [Trichormus variabilis FSR]MBC1302072.1 ABC transporter substrate-binding protein [Trichormus variabilis N2B]